MELISVDTSLNILVSSLYLHIFYSGAISEIQFVSFPACCGIQHIEAYLFPFIIRIKLLDGMRIYHWPKDKVNTCEKNRYVKWDQHSHQAPGRHQQIQCSSRFQWTTWNQISLVLNNCRKNLLCFSSIIYKTGSVQELSEKSIQFWGKFAYERKS